MTQTPMPAAFGVIAKELFGDVIDARELWELRKNAPDGADLHNDNDGKQPKGHKKLGGLLLLGTAAETDATVHAAQSAARTLRSAESIGSKAGSLGRAGLQAANLTVGLAATRQLMKKPKPVPAPRPVPAAKQPVAKGDMLDTYKAAAKTVGRKLRPVRHVMSPEQAADIKNSLQQGSRTGVRVAFGATAGAAAGGGYALGRRQRVAKAFRVKPLNPGNVPRVVTLKARKPPMAPPLSKAAADLEPVLNSLDDVAVAAKNARKKKATPTQPVGKALSFTGEISKVDEDKRLVFGWCSLSQVDGKPVVDLQGDYVPLDEIEKSAYKYVIESRKGGDMHKRVSKTIDGDEPLHTADMVESFVVTPEKLHGMGLPEDALPHGWWVGFKVNDEAQWQMVKTGERAGFSIHGTGHRRAA